MMQIVQLWLKEQGLPMLSQKQLDQLFCYRERLLEVNQYMNLTAITDEDEITVKHFIDSLTLLHWVNPQYSWLDVGSGAGFPGLVLKIVQPDMHITLMDSMRKRVFFLREMVDMLGLNGVECLHARAEEAVRQDLHKGQYDIVSARAVASLPKLVKFCLPFLKPGGIFLAMKGPDVEAEIKEALSVIKKRGGTYKETQEFFISQEIKHSVVMVEKGHE